MNSILKLLFLVFAMTPTSAFAHWGHVGELAGHGHVIAIGAAAVAAALAAALLKPGRKKTDDESADAQDEVENEPEPEAA